MMKINSGLCIGGPLAGKRFSHPGYWAKVPLLEQMTLLEGYQHFVVEGRGVDAPVTVGHAIYSWAPAGEGRGQWLGDKRP